MQLGRTAVAALILVAFAGCEDDDPRTDAGMAPSLTATVTQYRPDEGTRRISVEVTNSGTVTVHVSGVALSTSAFEPVSATAKGTEFAPGQTIALVTTYGDPRCEADATTTDAVAVLTLAGATAPTTLEVPVARTGQDVLERLHHAECQQAALDAVADVRLLPEWRRVRVDGDPYLRGTLLLRRPGGHPSAGGVTVTATRGSVLLELRPVRRGRPVGRLDPGEATERIPVLLGSANRCDAHALGGSTQTFLLSAFVRRDGGPQQRVLLIPDAATKRRALRVLDAVCGADPG